MFGAHVADAAGNHDRLVVAANLIVPEGPRYEVRLEGAKVAGEIRSAEFVVERGTADWPFDHDFERSGQVIRVWEIRIPRVAP